MVEVPSARVRLAAGIATVVGAGEDDVGADGAGGDVGLRLIRVGETLEHGLATGAHVDRGRRRRVPDDQAALPAATLLTSLTNGVSAGLPSAVRCATRRDVGVRRDRGLVDLEERAAHRVTRLHEHDVVLAGRQVQRAGDGGGLEVVDRLGTVDVDVDRLAGDAVHDRDLRQAPPAARGRWQRHRHRAAAATVSAASPASVLRMRIWGLLSGWSDGQGYAGRRASGGCGEWKWPRSASSGPIRAEHVCGSPP